MGDFNGNRVADPVQNHEMDIRSILQSMGTLEECSNRFSELLAPRVTSELND